MVAGFGCAGVVVTGRHGLDPVADTAPAPRPAVQRALALERLRAQAVDAVAGQTDLLMAGRLAAQCAHIAQSDARVAQADHALNRLDAQAAAGFAIAGTLTLAGVLAGAGYLVDAGVIGAPRCCVGAAGGARLPWSLSMPCAVVPWKQAAPVWLHVAWGHAWAVGLWMRRCLPGRGCRFCAGQRSGTAC